MGLIDADVLKEELIKALHEDLMDIDEAIDVVVTTIDDAPTVDPVKRGRVIDGKCSVCNHKMNAWACDFVYCPYCKAKMDEVKDETD